MAKKRVIHELKILPEFYEDVMSGFKTFEVRKADRDFRIGDLIKLNEWEPYEKKYTGSSMVYTIGYILGGGSYGIESGYCVIGFY
jgi:hypothetical protein